MSTTGSIGRTTARTLGDRSEGQVAKRPGLVSAIRRQRLAVTGFLLVAIFMIVAIMGPLVAPHGPTEQFSQDRLQAPSAAYPFGTDEFGRDILSRLLYGARISFEVGLIAVGLAGTLGVVLGMVAGYRGGWLDNVLTLLMDVVFAFPAILLAIAIITMLGNSLANVMIAIAIVYTPTFMRVVRGATLSVRHQAYVEAAVATGTPTTRILTRHIFPNITAPLIVHASLNFAFAVLAEASLAFLGLGNKPPAPSWGSMVSSSYGFLQLAPWAAIVPGTAIALTVLGFNLLGDGLRDALDPRLRR
ncbi:MAG: ABC transporter permease [Thermomicrobiales bacterium]|jgi:peptide/nickel transport system permease protein